MCLIKSAFVGKRKFKFGHVLPMSPTDFLFVFVVVTYFFLDATCS